MKGCVLKKAAGVFTAAILAAHASGAGDPTVVVRHDADKAVRFAAGEFAKYYRAVTGRRIAVDTVASDHGPNVWICVDPASFAGLTDAYRIVSKEGGLDISGRNGRSAIYGVYDFLSRRCGCRWFWDGDVVPKAATVDLTGMDVLEQSRFEFRGCQYFAHRSLKRFQAELWGFDDWRREIDWALKSRLNVIMLQTGIEDLFQKAFPEIVSTPDPDVTAKTDGGPGYNVRTPFWSLSYRNLLRKAVLGYATDRGLMHPVVYGPRTHWYSRTPQEFLDKVHPDFLPQEIEHYSEPSGRIWDIRQEKWFDAYWRLTEASISEYGYSGLLFNPGFDERILFTNRTKNVETKILYLEKFNREAARRYPDARLLLEGWDFFGQWSPDEVRRFVQVADPSRMVIWNYTSDEDDTRGAPHVPVHNNFLQWGVTNRFPYVFGSMVALNRASDIRGDYEKMRSRAELVRNDPMCKGYVLWPEMSHGDIFAWRFFVDNCWNLSQESVSSLLAGFCRDRYGDQAKRLLPIWRKVVGFSCKAGWDRNFTCNLIERWNSDGYVPQRNKAGRWLGARCVMGERYAEIPAAEIFSALAGIDWEGVFVQRDTIDLARTVLDRILYATMEDVMAAYYGVSYGKYSAERFKELARRYVETMRCMADVLDLHGDFSVSETWDAVNAVEKVRNPGGEHLLFENSACSYCRGFQAEYVRSMFLPLAEEIMSLLVMRIGKGDFSPLPPPTDYLEKRRQCRHPILSCRPDPRLRTAVNYRNVMKRCAEVTSGFGAATGR